MSKDKGGIDKFLATIARILSTFTSKNGKHSYNGNIIRGHSLDKAIKFRSRTIPSVSIYEYLKRVASLTKFSKEILISALIYIDKIIKKEDIFITVYELHRYSFFGILL